jgi:hypothetical protein
MTGNRNTVDSAQDGPGVEPGSTPTIEPRVGAEAQPAGGTDPEEQAGYIASIQDNYSQYVAASQVTVGNAVAFNPGDPVNADHPRLQQWIKDGLVESVKDAVKTSGKR